MTFLQINSSTAVSSPSTAAIVTDIIPFLRAIANMRAFQAVLAGLQKWRQIVLGTMTQITTRATSKLLVSAFGLLFATTALGQGDAANQAVIEIVRLEHRNPTAVREAIAPMLDPRGAISQIDNNLIISTSRANLAELQALISALDTPLRQVRISVDFTYTPGASPQNIQDALVNSNPSDGNVIDAANLSEPTDNSRQSIVVSEGEYAYFSTFDTTPRLSMTAVENGLLLTENQQQSGQSLGLSAELRDSEALLRIATAQSQAEANAADLQSRIVNTSVVLDFDEWFVLNEEPLEEIDSSIATTTLANPADAIAIKVELMP